MFPERLLYFAGVLLGNRSRDNDLSVIWEVQETYGGDYLSETGEGKGASDNVPY